MDNRIQAIHYLQLLSTSLWNSGISEVIKYCLKSFSYQVKYNVKYNRRNFFNEVKALHVCSHQVHLQNSAGLVARKNIQDLMPVLMSASQTSLLIVWEHTEPIEIV